MAKLRKTDQDEIDRFTERMKHEYSKGFNDKDDFNTKFENFITQEPNSNQKEFRDKVFKEMNRRFKNVRRTDNIFKRAKGRDLARDRTVTARKVVTNVPQYVKIGARRSDLKGLDTKQRVYGYLKGKRRKIFTRVPVTYKSGKFEMRYYSKQGKRLAGKFKRKTKKTNRRS